MHEGGWARFVDNHVVSVRVRMAWMDNGMALRFLGTEGGQKRYSIGVFTIEVALVIQPGGLVGARFIIRGIYQSDEMLFTDQDRLDLGLGPDIVEGGRDGGGWHGPERGHSAKDTGWTPVLLFQRIGGYRLVGLLLIACRGALKMTLDVPFPPVWRSPASYSFLS